MLDQDASFPENIRAIISTTNNDAVAFPETNKDAPWIIPAIKGPRYFFHSNKLAVESLINKGISTVAIDWSFSFDSNVASHVKGYVYNKAINESDLSRVKKLLELKGKANLQIDLMPYLIENLARYSDRAREPIIKTIAAFKSLDYINWEKFYSDSSMLEFVKDFSSIEREAENIYDSLADEYEIRNQLLKQRFSYAFLLELSIQWIKK